MCILFMCASCVHGKSNDDLTVAPLAQEKGRVSARGCYHWQFPTLEFYKSYKGHV